VGTVEKEFRIQKKRSSLVDPYYVQVHHRWKKISERANRFNNGPSNETPLTRSPQEGKRKSVGRATRSQQGCGKRYVIRKSNNTRLAEASHLASTKFIHKASSRFEIFIVYSTVTIAARRYCRTPRDSTHAAHSHYLCSCPALFPKLYSNVELGHYA